MQRLGTSSRHQGIEQADGHYRRHYFSEFTDLSNDVLTARAHKW